MKKILTFFLAAATAVSAMATTFNFNSSESVNQTADGISVSISKGSGNNAPAYYSNGLRLYENNTITISGQNLSSISLSFAKQGSKAYAPLTASAGTLASGGTSTSETDIKTDIWTGNASTVTFTLGTGQRLISKIVVNGSGSETDPSDKPDNSDKPDDSTTLIPDYTYSEPTPVGIPSTTVQGDAYAFVSNNILVSATKGAITDSYFSVHAGFKLTFTATRPIKGIVIDGFVKSGFEASTTAGNISYLTPSSDKEASPVVVLTDVNSKSVTISCVKQLRCYAVEVYFEENPQATVDGGTSGSAEDLDFDSAEAVYESAFVDIIGQENYSLFLYNQSDYDTYFALDLYPSQQSDITGTYSYSNGTLGDYTYYVYGSSDNDITWAEGGSATITKSGDIYTVSASILCDNGVTYNVVFSGQIPFYTDDEYYDEDIPGTIENISSGNNAGDSSQPIYNMMGREVNSNYKGIVIRGGKKYLNR